MSKDLDEIRTHLKILDDADPQFHLRSAVASFLFMVMPIDGETHPKEFDRLCRILADEFEISDNETFKLIKHARENQLDDDGMTETAGILKAGFPKSELLILVSHMWEMVFADGVMHEAEVSLVERVAHLLDITPDEISRVMLT
ncbi:MAG: TerB family tellurite resistance protein [Rhizobiaceae bacterium]